MLILTRRVGESLMIGDDIQIAVLGVKGNQVRIGILDGGGRVLTGPELENLDAVGFAAVAADISVYARVSPQQKLRIVKALQHLGEFVLNLVNALRRPEVRGQWGELTLRRLAELAGMVEHCDFYEQVHSSAEDNVIRPDMVVRMPDQRELVVDVKTPLDAYLEAVEAQSDAQRKLGLEKHARNVRAHIRTLASKAYWSQFEESPEFVILFIPGDQFLSAALNEEPDLIEYALKSDHGQ